MDGQNTLPLVSDHAAEVLDLYTTHRGRMADWEADRDRWHDKVFDLVEAGWSIKRVAELHTYTDAAGAQRTLTTTRIHAIIARVAERRQKAAEQAAGEHPLMSAPAPADAAAA